MSEEQRLCCGLFRRRSCVVPTRRGWLLLTVAAAALTLLAMRVVHPFLAVSAPTTAQVLVVEGWAPDYALKAAMEEFRRGAYSRLFVTGGPLERGSFLAEYKTYAELGAATLIKLGLTTNIVQAVPAPWVRQDRTYTSAVTLRTWLKEHGAAQATLNVMSVGAHSRRTRLLFEKAFGRESRIGILATEHRDYDARRWWASSSGVRIVTDELVGYAYARVFFYPSEP